MRLKVEKNAETGERIESEIPERDPVPVFATQEAAIAALVAWVEGFIFPLVGGVPAEERLAWPVKEAAAAAYADGVADAAQVALIEGEATITGEEPVDLCALILARAATFRTAVAAISGLRRKVTAAILAEDDPFQFEVILASAKGEAIQLAKDLGLADHLGVA